MFDIFKNMALLLCFALVSISIEPALAGRARYPTRPKQNESIEESIGRLRYDEARGRRMLAEIEKDFAKTVGPQRLAAIKGGTCPGLICVRGRSNAIARSLMKRRDVVTRQLSELTQERAALTAMYTQMNAPLAANTLSQPGVSQQQPVAAGSSTNPNPSTSPGNNMMPVAPGTAPAAPASPAGGVQPAAPPANGAEKSPTSNGASF
ncbi:MAG: hypothetical protein V4760_06890 [Bdellovibrionota bacterium]